MNPKKKTDVIIQTVSENYGVDPTKICRKTPNDKTATEARYVAMLLIRRHTTYTIAFVSEMFGYSHNNLALQQISDRERLEPVLKRRISDIDQLIKNKYELLQNSDTGGFIPGR